MTNASSGYAFVHVSVAFLHGCLGIFVLSLIVDFMFSFVSISQCIDWEGSVFYTSQEIGWEDCPWNVSNEPYLS